MPMCFRWIGRLVTSMMLIVLLSNVNGQPVQISSSSDTNYCDVEQLEIQLARMNDRLNRMQAMISSMNNPSIKENCTVDLAAYGYNDTMMYGYIRTSGGSSEQTYVPEWFSRYRGVTLVELDPKTCRTKNRQRFDIWAIPDDGVDLLETLESTAARTIIVGVTADSVERDGQDSFENFVGSFFTRYNMNLTENLFRSKFAFILQKGYPKKTKFEIKARYGESLRMKVALRGSTIYDVTFN